MKMASSLILLLFFSFSAIAQDYHFLLGTWKVKDKAQFEYWAQSSPGELIGKSYVVKDGEQKISETLSISKEADNVIYRATVLTQNAGVSISFTLNSEEEKVLSFENDAHDFPKKIRYTFIADDQILVEVWGENEEGFSYLMIKQ
ncbi:MAG: hypothetical protein ACI9A7_002545 [Cyclobacteriaceae bacterium]|jgi:hypothetical protein